MVIPPPPFFTPNIVTDDVSAKENVKAFSFPSLGKHTLIYGTGIVASKAVAFILLPIYTRFLTPADYGVLQLISLVLEVAAIAAGSRLAQGVYHFYHQASTPESRGRVLVTATALSALTFFSVATVGIATSPWIATFVFGAKDPFAFFVKLAVTAMAFESLIIVPLAFIQLAERSKLFVAVQFSKLLLQAFLNILFVVALEMGVAGVLWSTLIANLLLGAFLTVMLVQNNGYRISVATAWQLIRYGYPLVVTQVATMILVMGDRFFLNRAAGEAVVGIYGLAYQFAMLVLLVGYIPFEQIWNPTRFSIARREDRSVIFSKAFTYLNVGLSIGVVGVSVLSWDVIRIMADASFHAASIWVGPITALCVLQAWTFFHNMGLMVTERTGWYASANWVGAAVALVGFITLIPIWSISGAIVTGVVAMGTRFVLVYAWSHRFWPMDYKWGPTAWLAGGTIVVVVGAMYARPDGVVLSGVFSVAAVLGYLAFVWLAPVLSKEEKAAARSIVRVLGKRVLRVGRDDV